MEKKLCRSRVDRKLNGVCGGLAVYFNLDVTIVRVLCVLLTFATGGIGGILMYIACIFIIPEESEFLDVKYKEKP